MPRGRPKKTEKKTQLTEQQINSIKRIDMALHHILNSYRSLEHPSYNHIVNLDDSYIDFHFTFREIVHND